MAPIYVFGYPYTAVRSRLHGGIAGLAVGIAWVASAVGPKVPISDGGTRHLGLVRRTLRSRDTVRLHRVTTLLSISRVALHHSLDGCASRLHLLNNCVAQVRSNGRPNSCQITRRSAHRIRRGHHVNGLTTQFVRPNSAIFFSYNAAAPFIISFVPSRLRFATIYGSLGILLGLSRGPGYRVIVYNNAFRHGGRIFRGADRDNVLSRIHLA